MQPGTIRRTIGNAIARRGFVPAVLAAAALVRLAWVAWIWSVGTIPASDAGWYHQRALEMATGGGYAINGVPTAYWPVGYPAFLALLVKLFGSSPLAGMLANVAMQVGTAALARTTAQKLFASETVGRLTLLALAFWPNQIAYGSLLLSEPLFVLLMLAAIALLLAEKRPVIAAISSGAVFGLAALVKPQALFLPALCAVAMLFRIRSRPHIRKLVGRSALIHVVMILAVLPWIGRNAREIGGPGILSTNDGINLLIGNNPDATGDYHEPAGELQQQLRAAASEQERNVMARDMALEYIRTDLPEVLGRAPLKLWYLYRADTEGFSHNLIALTGEAPATRRMIGGLKIVAELYYLLACALLLAYYAARWRRGTVPQPEYPAGMLIIGYFTLIPMIFFGDGRFHYPAIPWIAMYGAAFAASLIGKENRRQ